MINVMIYINVLFYSFSIYSFIIIIIIIINKHYLLLLNIIIININIT